MSCCGKADQKIGLVELEKGLCGQVVATELEDNDLKRLAGLGVVMGGRVKMISMSDPVILEAYGARLSLAKSLARQIEVLPCTELSCKSVA